MAQNVATKTDENVAIFSLEMGAEQLVMRMLCAEGNIDAQVLRTGALEAEDWRKLTMAMGSLSNAGIFIDDSPVSVSMKSVQNAVAYNKNMD